MNKVNSRYERIPVLDQRGFSLVELIVVMAIFVVVLVMTSSTFENIIKKAAVESKSAASQIEGVVGLEVFRYDLEHAGYGLPWSFQNVPAPYEETVVDDESIALGISPKALNDVPPSPPHGVLFSPAAKEVSGISGLKSGVGPDYLVIKSAIAGMNPTARKWSYLNYSTNAAGQNLSHLKSWGSNSTDFSAAAGDNAITINSSFSSDGVPDRRLVMNSTAFSFPVTGPYPPAAYMPGDATALYTVYGIDKTSPRMPYNRADFYVKRPAMNMPQVCSGGTGILYKGVVRHENGKLNELPLLNCVGDLQVVLDLDVNGDGSLTPLNTQLVPDVSTPPEIVRNQLKNIRVYILAHDGGLDRGFTYPAPNPDSVITVGTSATQGRIWSKSDMEHAFGSDWMHYRWKVYSIVARPHSLK